MSYISNLRQTAILAAKSKSRKKASGDLSATQLHREAQRRALKKSQDRYFPRGKAFRKMYKQWRERLVKRIEVALDTAKIYKDPESGETKLANPDEVRTKLKSYPA